jgi:hypothetical protein
MMNHNATLAIVALLVLRRENSRCAFWEFCNTIEGGADLEWEGHNICN